MNTQKALSKKKHSQQKLINTFTPLRVRIYFDHFVHIAIYKEAQ